MDRIWPRILGPRESCPEEREFTLEGSEEILLKAEEYAHALAEKAEERETAIDRKLFSLFSISTVASSVMIALPNWRRHDHGAGRNHRTPHT